MGCHCLLPGIFLTQGWLNPCILRILHWQAASSLLCYLGSPKLAAVLNIWQVKLLESFSCCCSVTSHVWVFVTPWTAACQASLSFTISQSLLKLMSIDSVRPSNYLILCNPLHLLLSIFPSIGVFSNESALWIRWPNIGISASASILSVTIQYWFPLGWTGLISLQSKRLPRVTTIWKHQFFSTQPSCFNSHIHTSLLEKL